MSTYLASKPRYEILDGLRGVAAMMVVAYHLFETYYHGAPDQPVNHGYLAVDFFFVLSGFVIGYAYDDRWKDISGHSRKGGAFTLWSFFKRRLVRLHPMVIFGTHFGALLFYFGDSPDFPLIKEASPWLVLLVMLWGFTMIPMGTGMDVRGWGETNPLNGPAWSLQWEYLANILYALVFRRLGKIALSCCVALFALMTVVLCLNIDITGYLAARAYAQFTVVGGWALSPDQLQVGLTRLLYPFFCGLLLSRLQWLIKVRGGFWWCSLLIVVLLGMPWMGLGTEGDSRWTNGLYECLCILVAFPLIVSIGAGSSVFGGKSQAVNKFLGEISYPIYITHYPLVYMQMSWARSHAGAPLGQHIFVAVSIFVLAIFVAYASLKLYDQPVREWLQRKVLHKK
ncbi:MAG: acyltransferase [Prevotella sp.]|nr:acyltransferase [Prevotella sp.]